MKNPIFIWTSVIIITVIIFTSCKKDKFKNEYAVFEGKWNWQYSYKEKFDSFGNYLGTEDTIFPFETGYSYKIEFKKNGRITILQGGAEIHCWKKSCVSYFVELSNGVIEYFINLNCVENDQMHGFIFNTEQMSVEKYPFLSSDSGGYHYLYENYFEKEN